MNNTTGTVEEAPKTDDIPSLESDTLWQRYHGLLLTISTIVILETLQQLELRKVIEFKVPNPGSYYALAVAYTAAAGGMFPGVIAAVLGMTAIMIDASIPQQPFHFDHAGTIRIFGNFLALGGTALVVGFLKNRNAALVAENARRLIEAKTQEVEAAAAKEGEAKLARVAETLQRSLLLTPPNDALPGVTFATFYEAAWEEAQIGGDFMDAFSLENGKVAFVVGDVTGKGVIAAARTAEVKFVLRAYLRDDSSSAARAVERLNAFLCVASAFNKNEATTEFVCLSLTLIDPTTGEVQIVTAGAESALLIRQSGQIEPVVDSSFGGGGSCPMLGVDPDLPYSATTLTLGMEDALLLLTDGITEARRPSDRAFFGEVALVNTLRQVVSHIPPGDPGETALRALARAAKDFVGGRLHDDVCLLLLRRREAEAV